MHKIQWPHVLQSDTIWVILIIAPPEKNNDMAAEALIKNRILKNIDDYELTCWHAC